MPPDDFIDLVRDALLHLYDLPRLQTHALAEASGNAGAAASRGGGLRQALLDAIEALHTEPGTAADSRPWRTYRILELRYIEGLDVAEVMDEVALGKTQYHREHHRALEAVALVLWERWDLAERWCARGGSIGGRSATVDVEIVANPDARTDPVDVVRGLAELVRPLCAARDLQLRLTLPDAVPAIRGDRVALRHALLPILTAAVKLATGSVDLSVRDNDQSVEIDVAGHSTGTPEAETLVVAESQAFIRAIQGSVDLITESGSRAGWRVRFSFPTVTQRALLVVDNSADFVRLIQRYLTGRDWDVLGANDVDLALAIARERRPHAILLDVVMPGRDGWDLLGALRADPMTSGISVIVCSVLHESDIAIALGATAYLNKPIGQAELLAELARLG